MQTIQKRRKLIHFGPSCPCCLPADGPPTRLDHIEVSETAEKDENSADPQQSCKSWAQGWDDWEDFDGQEYSDAHCHLDYVIQNEKHGNMTWNSKSEFCRWWAANWDCPNGENCLWAHGEEELESRLALELDDIRPFVRRHFGARAAMAGGGLGGQPWCGAGGGPVLRSLVTNCCELASIPDTVFLATEAELGGTVYCTFGCHPGNFRHYDDQMEARLLAAMEACGPRAVAWGECGLDYCKNWWEAEDPVSHSRMLEVFARQARLAVARGWPLVVHSRLADDDTLKVLAECVPRDHKVHIHAFQGSVAMMREALAMLPNCFFGVSSAVVLSHPCEGALDIARQCPLDRLVLETDSPYLGWEPREIPKVARKVAKLKQLSAKEVLEAATANSHWFYGIPPPDGLGPVRSPPQIPPPPRPFEHLPSGANPWPA